MENQVSEGNVGEFRDISIDLAQSIRLGLKSEVDGMRLFAAKLVRKYRQSAPDLSRQIDEYLQAAPVASPMRKKTIAKADPEIVVENDDAEELALLRIDTAGAVEPLLSEAVRLPIQQLLAERRQSKKLQEMGLEPMRSAVFVGPPGVGKTMTAKWIAAELGLPLLVLDLTAIMSSYLGRTGNNLRAVLNYAKSLPCVLLLDEIDAIAKRRGDMSDVGELKRLVTVILQEIDAWPSTSLLLAATNHAELIDPALWRRFDQTVEFPQPDKHLVEKLLRNLMSSEGKQVVRWLPTITMLLEGNSFSDVERTARQFRKAITLKTASIEELVEGLARRHAALLDRVSRQDLAKKLTDLTRLSQHKVSDITGVSRDTIRKHQKQEHVTHGD
jgi:SpoVK/Ycf46/Vps4 family AAA+-type ATPase